MTRVCHLCVEQQRSGDALLDKVGGVITARRDRVAPPNLLTNICNVSSDPFPGGGAKAGAASDRVDGDVSVRLQGRENDALPQRHDAAGGPRRRGTVARHNWAWPGNWARGCFLLVSM